MSAMTAIYSSGILHKSKARLMMKYKKVNIIIIPNVFLYESFSADLISTIEFNEDGEFLAVGDKGGRIVVFQREKQVRYL
jgi:hypothetical protein